jgi:AmmeMemoRadiSam system protein A
MHSPEYSVADRQELLRIARASVAHGVQTGSPLAIDHRLLSPTLSAVRASFVTLRLAGELRGCTGSLEAVQPLALEVAESACRTALSDPRFPPVQARELTRISMEIAVLTPLETLTVEDEADLLTRLNPGVDGLVMDFGSSRSTFLPKVWDHLPDPRSFVGELKLKAGLPRDYWSPDVVCFRYRTENFEETTPDSL